MFIQPSLLTEYQTVIGSLLAHTKVTINVRKGVILITIPIYILDILKWYVTNKNNFNVLLFGRLMVYVSIIATMLVFCKRTHSDADLNAAVIGIN